MVPDSLIIFNQAYGFWVQTGAIIISIAVTGYFAQKAIKKNGESAKTTLNHNHEMIRKRATIDILIQENQDTDLVQAKRIVAQLPPEASFIKYMEPSFCDTKEAEAEKESIRILLNRYEFIALGIRTGAFEEEIYKRLISFHANSKDRKNSCALTCFNRCWKNSKALPQTSKPRL